MSDDKIRQSFMPAGQTPNFLKHLRQFPTSAYFRRMAPRRVPRFAFEYCDTGAGDAAPCAGGSGASSSKSQPESSEKTRRPGGRSRNPSPCSLSSSGSRRGTPASS